jgi:hypothetical protein
MFSWFVDKSAWNLNFPSLYLEIQKLQIALRRTHWKYGMMNIAYRMVSMAERSNIFLKKLKHSPLLKKKSIKKFQNKSLLKTFIKDEMGPTSRHKFQ